MYLVYKSNLNFIYSKSYKIYKSLIEVLIYLTEDLE